MVTQVGPVSGRKFRRTTTGSQHCGGKQNQKHKTTPEPTNQTQTTTPKTKQTPKKSEMDVSETVKRSKLPLSEPLRCSPQRNSLPIQLPCVSYTSRSILEKVALWKFLYDGITLLDVVAFPFIMAVGWYSCYPSWYHAFSLCFSGERMILDTQSW